MLVIKKKSSIATRMIIFIICVTVFVASVAFFIVLSQDYKKEMKRVEERMEDIKVSLMPPLALSIYNMDDKQVTQGLKGILNVPGIVEVRVRLTDETKDSFSLIHEKFKNVKQEKRRGLGPQKRIKIIYQPELESVGEEIGTLYLYSTLELAIQRIKVQMLNFSIIQLVQVVVLAIAIFIIFRNLISKHLKNMATYAKGIDLEDLSGPDLMLERDKSLSNDELQDLTDSFNDMRTNLKGAHAKLKDYAENLESIVDKRTHELNQEKNNVTKLLHNMSQAVFKVNENKKIVGPISNYTVEMFGEDIMGKDIFEVLYKEIDPKSIVYSDINSLFNVTFRADDIQWFMMEHTMPEVLGLDINGKKRILHSVHDPIFNDNEELEYILYVVEDITEKVAQEKELLKKDEQLKIMKEAIDFGQRKDLVNIMNQNFSFIIDSLNHLEKMYTLKNRTGDEDHLKQIFRNLHSIKGTSGSLVTLRDKVHIVEDEVIKVIEKPEIVDKKFIKNLDQELHKIHGTLFRYIKVMNEQLKMGINFDNEILKGIKEKHEELEKLEERENWFNYINFLENEFVLFSKMCLAVNENDLFLKIDEILENIKQNKIAGIIENDDVKVSINKSILEIKNKLRDIIEDIKKYSEQLSVSMEEGIPLENFDCVKKELWNLQKKGQFDKDSFEKICSKINNESLFSIFKSFDKNIKEMSTNLGKKVSLKVEGEDVLIDSIKAQQLRGILTHIVRNTLDHGIESPEERRKKGKEEYGVLKINCSKENNKKSMLKINIEDDGNGIDSAKLFKRALKYGVIDNENMREDEKVNLIFLPTLSTKEETTKISGRGVGMDIVKSLVGELGGEIKVSSILSKGTKFEIIIPD